MKGCVEPSSSADLPGCPEGSSLYPLKISSDTKASSAGAWLAATPPTLAGAGADRAAAVFHGAVFLWRSPSCLSEAASDPSSSQAVWHHKDLSSSADYRRPLACGSRGADALKQCQAGLGVWELRSSPSSPRSSRAPRTPACHSSSFPSVSVRWQEECRSG